MDLNEPALCAELAARVVVYPAPYLYGSKADDARQESAAEFCNQALEGAYRSPDCCQSRGPLVGNMQRIGWSPFVEWWCVPLDLDDDSMLRELCRCGCLRVGYDLDLIRERLHGGFVCGVGETYRHVALEVGTLSYAHPETNQHLTVEQRQATWRRLMRANRLKRPFLGGGPFSGDAPPPERRREE